MFTWGAATKYTVDPVLEYCSASVVDNLSALNQQWAATLDFEPKLSGKRPTSYVSWRHAERNSLATCIE